MSTIQGTIKLIDQFSPTLHSILNAIDQTVTAMDQLDTVSSDAFVGARDAIDAAKRSVFDLDTAIGKIGKDIMPEVEDEAQKVKKAFGEWNPTLLNVSAALNIIQTGIGLIKSGWSAVTGLLHTSDTQTMAETQLGTVMANMGGTYEGYKNVKAAASGMQSKTTFSDESMLAGAAEIGTYLSDSDAIAALLPTLADYAAGMGGPKASAEQMTQYATNLAKTFAGSFDAMNEKGFVFDEAQKKIMKTGTEMEKVAVLNEVIGEGWGGLAEQFAATPQGQMIQLENTLNNMKETMGAELYPAVQQLIQAVMDNLPTIQMLVDGIVLVLQRVIGFVTSVIIPAIAGVVNWIRNHIESLKLAILILGATVSVIAAIMAVKWMIAHWPILLIIAAVLGLIALLDRLGVSASDVVSYVAGLFGGLCAFLFNLIASVWNYTAGIAEFFANVFIDPVTAVKNLFKDMANYVLDLLWTIANAIDAIFKTNLTGVIDSWRSNFNTWLGDVPENKIQIKRMDLIDTADTAKTWGDYAAKAVDGVFGAFDLSGLDTSGLDTTNQMVEGMFGNGGGVGVEGSGGGGAVQTTGEVSLADEDLKYILDATERRYISYVNLSPTAPYVQITFGDVHETADVEQIQDYLVDAINRSLPVTSAYAGAEANP